MTAPTLVSLSELKTYLGITGTADDSLLASCASNASAKAQQDTGRQFAVASNVTSYISTDGQSALTLDRDRPFTDASRTIVFQSATMTEGTDIWFLPDRRNPAVTNTIQLRYFDRSHPFWYKANPNWFDANLDNLAIRFGTSASPNNLVITGVVGHPDTPWDVKQAVLELAAWMYYRAKGGASGMVTTPSGQQLNLTDYPPVYQQFLADWTVRTNVMPI